MREILFRGKDIVSGEWITGFLVDGRHIGCWLKANPIRPETVGQFTGLTDKNGKKIFEGDIITVERGWNEKVNYIVEYDCTICSFIGDSINYIGFTTFENDGDRIEVIGNIHDNPELMKGENNG